MARNEEIGAMDLGVAAPAEEGGVGGAIDFGFRGAELAVAPGFRHC